MHNAPNPANAEGMPEMNGRSFFRGAATITAAAAGVAVMAIPAAPVTPAERARIAWDEFTAAMAEVAANADGWLIIGAGKRFGSDETFLHLRTAHLVQELLRPGSERMITVERHREIEL